MDGHKRLFVGNLTYGITDNEVRREFSKFGEISNLEIKNKKSGDGSGVSTFAFLDLTISEVRLAECLKALDGKKLLGSEIRVQVAKENFLSKLKNERGQAGAQKNGIVTARQPLQANYNPLEIFKAARNTIKRFDEGVIEDSGQDVVVDHSHSGKNGGIMNKLESFSSMWNDTDSKPVVVEQKVEVEQKVDPEEAKRKELDNQKRIQSLQQRKNQFKEQHIQIKAALSKTDKPFNKKIVFDNDPVLDNEDFLAAVPRKRNGNGDPVLDNEDILAAVPRKRKEPKPKASKPGMQLFDNEEEDGNIEGAGEQFKLKPQFAGKSGKELLELQSRFGNDERFRLDERFADEASTTVANEENDDDHEGSQEKDRQMSILSSLVPLGPTSTAAKDSNKLQKAFVRFDPKIKDHNKFELSAGKEEVKDGKKKSKVTFSEESATTAALPEVSSERYYSTTSTLKIGGQDKGGFSLRQLFQSSAPEEKQPEATEDQVEHEDEAVQEEQQEEEEETGLVEEMPKEGHQDGQQSFWKKAGMWHETFFLESDDSRLKETMDFILKKTSDVHYQDRSRWSDQRDRLIRFYRNKMRHTAAFAGNKKRSSDNTDQLPAYLYNSNASSSKKPRLKFYAKKPRSNQIDE